MKGFDLELAKAGNPVQTKDGKPARIICWDRIESDHPIVALVLNEDKESIFQYKINGEHYMFSNLDLVMAPTKQEMWINIYRNRDGEVRIGANYKSELNALEHIGNKESYICTKKLEWEE